MADTTYIVLRKCNIPVDPETEDYDDVWDVLQTVEAASAESAIKKVAVVDGTLVAVPARSWKPVTVTTETRTILKLEQPDPAA
jgi:CRISPR/Cas system CMR subunit Cmr4 (Cas7 group RAMP superfamily)